MLLADLVTLVSVAMQERKDRAPLRVLRAVPPTRAEVQGVTLASLALLGAGVAGPKRVASGSPKRRLQPGRHTRCASGVPEKGTWARIAQMRRQPSHLLSAGARKGEPSPCSWS